MEEVKVGLRSGNIPLTVSFDDSVHQQGCLCPTLSGDLAALICQKSSVPDSYKGTQPGLQGLYVQWSRLK